MIWEHKAGQTVWQLFENEDDLTRPRFPLAIVDKRGPHLGSNRVWYQVRGEDTEYDSLKEAQAAAWRLGTEQLAADQDAPQQGADPKGELGL